MKLNEVYEFSYNYLVEISKDYVTKEQINDFISNPDTRNCSTFEDAFELGMAILQNFRSLRNVIKFAERKEDIKKEIRFPNLDDISKLDPVELSNVFIKKYNANGKCDWVNYCKGIVSMAKFLNGFKSYDEFKALCNLFDTNVISRAAFALYLKERIHNMGFAMACNWLKELGYSSYAKPDTHMLDICIALGVIEEKKQLLDCFEEMDRIATLGGVTPYKLDKVWWLICSGNYYRYKIQLPKTYKEDFITKLKNKIEKY